MKNLLDYNKFKSIKINESYEDDPEYTIRKFFEKLKKNISTWFTEGSFSTEGSQLYDIKISTTGNMDKTLMFDFQDNKFYYQVIFIISLKEVTETNLSECFVKVKRYDLDNSTLLNEVDESVMVDDLTEDKLLEIFAKLDEVSDDTVDKEGNLETETVEGEEVDLGNEEVA